jgi:hypothetical protein
VALQESARSSLRRKMYSRKPSMIRSVTATGPSVQMTALIASAPCRVASTSSHAVETMHQPVCRSTSRERPTQPSICYSTGGTFPRV